MAGTAKHLGEGCSYCSYCSYFHSSSCFPQPTGCATTISRYFSSILQSLPHWLESPRTDLGQEKEKEQEAGGDLLPDPSCFLDMEAAPAGSATGLGGRLGEETAVVIMSTFVVKTVHKSVCERLQ